jgi:hypothetical protein
LHKRLSTLSKPLMVVAALGIGAGLGFSGNELARPDHFGALADYAGPKMALEYERCLAAKGFGHDLDPLTLREFCGAYVIGPFFVVRPDDRKIKGSPI